MQPAPRTAPVSRLARLIPYVLAVTLVLLTLWLRFRFDPAFSGPTLIVFTMPILLSAYQGGLWPGLLATGVAIAGANYYLPPHVGGFTTGSHPDLGQALLLAAAGILISVICEALHRSRKKADAGRAEAETRRAAAAELAAIVDSSTDAVIGKTLAGIITSWNAASARIFGYSAAEMVGASISRLVPPELMAEEARLIGEMKLGHNLDHYETTRLRKDGARIIVAMSLSPVRDDKDNIIGAAVMARDVTRKRAEDAHLRSLQSEMAHGERLNAMGQMSAAIAHEINQPLAAVTSFLGAAQMMLASPPLTPQTAHKVVEAIDRASEQALRAGTIIRHLREFVSKQEADRTPEDLNKVVTDAVGLCFPGKEIEIKLALWPDPLPVLVDCVQIQQVVHNLIRNGMEAMADAALETRRIDVTTLFVDGCATVDIRDTGPGLAPQALARLFEPFATTRQKGLGIGLTICQSIMESHDGSIRVLESTPKGAVFRLRLPLAPESLPG